MPKYKLHEPQDLNGDAVLSHLKKYFPNEQFTATDLAEKIDVEVTALSSAIGQLKKRNHIKLEGYFYKRDDKNNPRRISVWVLVK